MRSPSPGAAGLTDDDTPGQTSDDDTPGQTRGHKGQSLEKRPVVA